MKSKTSILKFLRSLFCFFLVVIPGNKALFGQILLQSGFEGTNPFSGFRNNQSCCPYSVTASTNLPHEGIQSLRLEVKYTDPPVSRGWRAELTTPAIRDTGDMWYGCEHLSRNSKRRWLLDRRLWRAFCAVASCYFNRICITFSLEF